MNRQVIRNSDSKVFEVQKYVKSETQESVWCNDWYGRHIIGEDCKWLIGDMWRSVNILPQLGVYPKYPMSSKDVLTTDGTNVIMAFYEDGWCDVSTEQKFKEYSPKFWMYLSDLISKNITDE